MEKPTASISLDPTDPAKAVAKQAIASIAKRKRRAEKKRRKAKVAIAKRKQLPKLPGGEARSFRQQIVAVIEHQTRKGSCILVTDNNPRMAAMLAVKHLVEHGCMTNDFNDEQRTQFEALVLSNMFDDALEFWRNCPSVYGEEQIEISTAIVQRTTSFAVRLGLMLSAPKS